jgi:hypothetical protein
LKIKNIKKKKKELRLSSGLQDLMRAGPEPSWLLCVRQIERGEEEEAGLFC